MRWPSVEHFLINNTWAWPLCEILHFVGLILLFGAVGSFDLRLLGLGRGLSYSLLNRLVPWGVFGFALCVATGLVFVTGIEANVPEHPYVVLKTNPWLQLKLLFILLAGLNLLVFHVTGTARAVERLGPNDVAPTLAKVIGGTSLALWVGVVYFGRLIPWAL
jgi:H+/Cl- antiporter ClcA